MLPVGAVPRYFIAMRNAAGHLDTELLRLVVITDGRGDPLRVEDIVRAALAGGARCVQLREPRWTARMTWQACERLRPLIDSARALLLVNDRVDVAAAGVAHGAQIGHKSLPPAVARRILGPHPVLGFSAHDQDELDAAADGGCDFALLSPVWPTESKPGLPHLGEARAAALTARARVPVVWLGGVDVEHAQRVSALAEDRRPIGVAVRGAVMHADDPARATAALLDAMPRSGETTHWCQPNRPDT